MIYFDEFSLNEWNINLWGWTNARSKGYIAQNIELFYMGFIVGFSQSYFYGIMDTTNTIDSKLAIEFINGTLQNRTVVIGKAANDIINFWDNAAYHKCKDVYNFMESMNIRWITIWPYEPWLNPTEKIIQLIKKKICSLSLQEK